MKGIPTVRFILLPSLTGRGKGVGLLLLLLFLVSCRPEKHTPSVMFGQPEDDVAPAAYDLADIQAAGELIAVTLSGPETYYEYRGRGFGLEFEMAEAFARSIGVRLRMEMAPDTATLLQRLASGEADLIAFPLDSSMLNNASLETTFNSPLGPTGRSTLGELSTFNFSLPSSWPVRDTSPELAAAISRWWKPDTRERFLAAEQARRRSARRSPVTRPVRPPMLSRANGVISSFDNLFIRHAATAGLDWRLLAAQCYQESAFNPRAVSWAGAQGLMQIMPGTAAHLGLAASEVYEPEKNIAAAARYLRELSATFADIPHQTERIRFVLAAYNGGVGHVRDAMALATKHGGDPHRWADVNPYILRLADPRFYRDPVVKNGYLRGSETSGYVQQIMERWNYYRGAAHPSAVTPSRSSGKQSNTPSRVRPRSDFQLPADSARKQE